jgi:hypothetical protein
MDNVTEIVALLRRQADLEIAIMNGALSAVATEQELDSTRQRLVAHPQALSARTTDGACLTTHAEYDLRTGCDGFLGIELLARDLGHVAIQTAFESAFLDWEAAATHLKVKPIASSFRWTMHPKPTLNKEMAYCDTT